MWLITPEGFFSIVEKATDKASGTLTVRARVASDLEALRGGSLPLHRAHHPHDALHGLASGAPETSARVGVRDMTTVSLSVEAVWKSFGSESVLRGIDLKVHEHQVVVLIGASGSGKSTLLKCINGLEPVDAGRILLDEGLDVTAFKTDLDAVRRRVGIVFQAYNLFPHMTVLDNVTLGQRKVLGRSREESEDRARRLLARFGLQEKAGEYPDRLSGGQQQRVAIVRAVAMSPEILLFDEITSALDPLLVGEVLDAVRELKEEGLTIVMATHEMGFAREAADRVCFLDGGVVLEEGTPEQVLVAPSEQRTREYLARFLG
jgi:polar amino acid transport system ATP-binding protein